jgi:hypothetical protein
MAVAPVRLVPQVIGEVVSCVMNRPGDHAVGRVRPYRGARVERSPELLSGFETVLPCGFGLYCHAVVLASEHLPERGPYFGVELRLEINYIGGNGLLVRRLFMPLFRDQLDASIFPLSSSSLTDSIGECISFRNISPLGLLAEATDEC